MFIMSYDGWPILVPTPESKTCIMDTHYSAEKIGQRLKAKIKMDTTTLQCKTSSAQRPQA
jgi:hypothetical protein